MTELIELPNGAVLEIHFRDWSARAAIPADLEAAGYVRASRVAEVEARLTDLLGSLEHSKARDYDELVNAAYKRAAGLSAPQSPAKDPEPAPPVTTEPAPAVSGEGCEHCGAGPHDPCDRGVDHSVVAEATERVTHVDARDLIDQLHRRIMGRDDEVSGIVATIVRYLAQQEADGNALKYWSTRARELEQALQTERAYKNGAKAKQEQTEREVANLREKFEVTLEVAQGFRAERDAAKAKLDAQHRLNLAFVDQNNVLIRRNQSMDEQLAAANAKLAVALEAVKTWDEVGLYPEGHFGVEEHSEAIDRLRAELAQLETSDS